MGEYDRKTFYMPVLENKTEWRGYNMCDSVEALPVAIRLENIRQNRKTYARILAFTRSGEEKQGEVSVNNPFRLESWKIYYQKDITNKNVQGVQFKLVKNPWDCITCCGMCLLVLGCVLFIIKKWN